MRMGSQLLQKDDHIDGDDEKGDGRDPAWWPRGVTQRNEAAHLHSAFA
jgi:hypothetical protein